MKCSQWIIRLLLVCCLTHTLRTPALRAAEADVISLTEWRSTFSEVEAEVSPKNPDFKRQLWNWAERFFRQARSVGNDRASRQKGRVALLKWVIITSYIVQLQGKMSLDGSSNSQAQWDEEIRINVSARQQADDLFGVTTVRASWQTFETICTERGWEPSSSPFSPAKLGP